MDAHQYEYLVCTRCMTYNQHLYIEDTLNGFCIQQTNFPFVCIIVDDASTDGEQEVIKKYFDSHFDLSETSDTDDYVMTFGRHKANENCYFAILYLKYNHYSIKKDKTPYYARWQDNCKYIALCEGDDYWVVADKMQKQVDILEKNEEYGMCYSLAKGYIQSKKTFTNNNYGEHIEGFEDLLKNGNRIPTLTTCFRKTIWDQYNEEIQPAKHGWLMGDYPIWLYAAHTSKIKMLDTVTSVYRILVNSASHSTDINKELKFNESVFDIRRFFAEKYGINYNNYQEDYNLAVFNIYFNHLIIEYNSNYAKELRKYYKYLSKRSLEHKICYYLSHNYLLWLILKALRKVKIICSK